MKPAVKESFSKIKSALGAVFLGPREVLGVDLGSYAVKVVLLDLAAKTPRLRSWAHIVLDLKPDSSPEERKQQTVRQLRAALIEKGMQVKQAAASVSGNSVIVRYVKFPRLGRNELTATLPTEAEPFIPFDIKDVQLGFHILGEFTEEGQRKMETVLVAAKRDVIQGRVEILEAAGLRPAIIDVDSFALENVLEISRNPKEEAMTILHLNIGHSVTNLSIVEGGVTRVVRDMFIAGSSFTKAIMKNLQCDFAKAEELKKAHGFMTEADEKEKAMQAGDKESLGVSQAVAAVMKDIVSEIHRSVDFYLSQGPERSISRILLSGGSAQFKNMPKYLAGELKVPVDILNPFASVENASGVPADVAPAMGVAVGLALRKNKDWA